MKKDILNRQDIEKLINAFYEKVRIDEEIGYFFSEIVAVNWEKHLPTMYDFWENILFYTGSYQGNPMLKHQLLHQKSEMTASHFERWLQLFNTTVDDIYEGEKANLIKTRALSIATMMQMKIRY